MNSAIGSPAVDSTADGSTAVDSTAIQTIDPATSDRARTEAEVDAAERDAKLLRYIAGSVSLVDVDGHIMATSGRYRPAFGYSAAFWETHSILDILIPDDLTRVLAMRETILAEPGAGITAEVQVARANGTIDTLEVTAVNLLHDPDLEGVVLTTREVTAEHEHRVALAALRDDALAEADQRSHLLALVSQKLRNPLHGIADLARTLATEPGLADADRQVAESVHRQVAALATAAEELLATARVDGGSDELHPTPIDISTLIDEAARVARQDARPDVVVEAVIDDTVPPLIVADAARLQQLLASLVSNAVAFTYAGSITVRAGVDVDTLVLSVADTGSGIPEHEAQFIFDPFTTSSTATTDTGAGLGLAIASRLAAAMSGRIEVESAVGRGSTFTITLPLCEDDRENDHERGAHDGAAVAAESTPAEADTAEPEPAESDRAEPDGPGPDSQATADRARILVVEDTAVNQVLARHQLDRIGMDAVIAETAEAGLSMLEQERFDAVLMDYQLPGMNGREATREIRRRGDQTPVVGLTASATAADRNKSLEAGMNHFLAKPAGIDELGSALHEVLAESTAHVDAAPESMTADGSTGSSDLRNPNDPSDPSDRENSEGDSGTDSGETIVELRVLDELAEELGDRSIVEGLVTTFVAELDGRRADITSDDDDLATRQAHTLRASARLLGAFRLADACERIESNPANRAEVSAAADDARDALVEWLTSSTQET